MRRLFIGGGMFELGLLVVGLTWIAPFAHRCSVAAAPPASVRATVSSTSPSTATNSAASGSVSVALDQWSVMATATTLPAGKVTLQVSNGGAIIHELVVLRTKTQAADILIGRYQGESNRINEDTAGTNVGETGDLRPGGTKTIALNLPPGHYVFLCNLPAHYGLGMHTDVTVSAA